MRRSLLTTSRPLRDGEPAGTAPAGVGSNGGPQGSGTTSGSSLSPALVAAHQRSPHSRPPPPRRSRRRPGSDRNPHTDRTDHAKRRRSLRSGWTPAATGDTLSIGGRVAARSPRRLGCSNTRAFTFSDARVLRRRRGRARQRREAIRSSGLRQAAACGGDRRHKHTTTCDTARSTSSRRSM
jgi:hypothetical protein